jgi:hypothetical protein
LQFAKDSAATLSQQEKNDSAALGGIFEAMARVSPARPATLRSTAAC